MFCKVIVTLSYIFIILGSIGMMLFISKFPFSTSVKDLELVNYRFWRLNGYQFWILSWLLIILGTFIQLIDYLHRVMT